MMYYKILCLTLCLSSYLGLGVYANECSTSTYEPCMELKRSIELKWGYFFFANSSLSNVYDDGGFDIRLVGSFPLWNCSQKFGLEVYTAAEYFHCSGKSISFGEDTTVWGIPLSIGLKPVFFLTPNLQYYCAFGPRYLYIHQHNDSSFVQKNLHSHCGGVFCNMGFDFKFWNCIYVDIFGEYSYARGHFHTSSPNVYKGTSDISNFAFGLGLGYAF